MVSSRQEYWRELPCAPPGDLPDPGIESTSLICLLHWQVGSLPQAWEVLISYVLCCVLVAPLYLTLCDPMGCSPPGFSVHGDSPGKNSEVGSHTVLQRIFPTQGSNPGLLHRRQILYHPSHQGSSYTPIENKKFSKRKKKYLLHKKKERKYICFICDNLLQQQLDANTVSQLWCQ